MIDKSVEKPNRIAELRKENKLTIQQLADAMGVANGTISRYEQGTREPKIAMWRKLADYFNVSTSYLQGLTDERQFKINPKEVDKYIEEWFDSHVVPLRSGNLTKDQKRLLTYDIDTIRKLVDRIIKQGNREIIANLATLLVLIADHVLTAVPVSENSKNEAKEALDTLLDMDVNHHPHA